VSSQRLPSPVLTARRSPLAPNEGAIFSVFDSFEERKAKGQSAQSILAAINQRLAGIEDAFIVTVEPPR